MHVTRDIRNRVSSHERVAELGAGQGRTALSAQPQDHLSDPGIKPPKDVITGRNGHQYIVSKPDRATIYRCSRQSLSDSLHASMTARKVTPNSWLAAICADCVSAGNASTEVGCSHSKSLSAKRFGVSGRTANASRRLPAIFQKMSQKLAAVRGDAHFAVIRKGQYAPGAGSDRLRHPIRRVADRQMRPEAGIPGASRWFRAALQEVLRRRTTD